MALGPLDAVHEAPRHRAQRELRVDSYASRDRYGRKEHVAHLLEDVGMRLRLRRRLAELHQRVLQLAELVLEICEGPVCPLVFEVDRGRAPLHLPRVEQCGERFRDVVEDPLALLLRALDLLPALAHATGRASFGVPEDVRMTTDELRVNSTSDLFEIARSLLREEEGEEVDLEEETAELVGELEIVPGDRRIRDLVRLFDGV